MASNKRGTTLFCSKVAIIAAVFLVLTLLSALSQPAEGVDKREEFGDELGEGVDHEREKFGDELQYGGEGVDEKVKFYLKCIRSRDEAPPGYYEDDVLCRDSFRAVDISYLAVGRFPPEFAEALQIKYKGNQTLIDIFICGIDLRRCSQETRELRIRYFRERAKHLIRERIESRS